MKTTCPKCKRNIGIVKDTGNIAKHRSGRSTKKSVKPYCEGTGKTPVK